MPKQKPTTTTTTTTAQPTTKATAKTTSTTKATGGAPLPKFLIKGVPRLCRSLRYKKSGKWAVKTRGPSPSQGAGITKPTTTKKLVQFGKKNQTRWVTSPKEPRFYPTDDSHKPLYTRKTVSTAKPKLRPSLVPGTVLILLAGRFRGKRVILLKGLSSGLLLVTGPYKINGVPLRRVNPRYVIATSTKVDVAGIALPEKLNDQFFKKPLKAKAKKSAQDFFEGDKKEKKEISPERQELQKEVDTQVLGHIKDQPFLKDYLNAHFSLGKGQYPHLLKF